jgi:hypothetical protein
VASLLSGAITIRTPVRGSHITLVDTHSAINTSGRAVEIVKLVTAIRIHNFLGPIRMLDSRRAGPGNNYRGFPLSDYFGFPAIAGEAANDALMVTRPIMNAARFRKL